MNPLWIIAILSAIKEAKGLFSGGAGSGQTQTGESTTETPYTGYRSPSLAFMDPYSLRMLLSNLGSMQYAGMPQGYGGLGMEDWTEDILKLLESSWPDIMQNLGRTTYGLQGEREKNPALIRRGQLRGG